MSDPNLIQLFYASSASVPFSEADLHALLKKARKVNTGLGVSGMLLYAEGSFFQVLEGPADTVEDLYNAIKGDRRHKNVRRIAKLPIDTRDFADWSMAHADVTPEEAVKIPGLSDFFNATEADDGERVSQTLLKSFRKGMWRARLS